MFLTHIYIYIFSYFLHHLISYSFCAVCMYSQFWVKYASKDSILKNTNFFVPLISEFCETSIVRLDPEDRRSPWRCLVCTKGLNVLFLLLFPTRIQLLLCERLGSDRTIGFWLKTQKIYCYIFDRNIAERQVWWNEKYYPINMILLLLFCVVRSRSLDPKGIL